MAHAYGVPTKAAFRPMVPLLTMARNADFAFLAF
jgi:hypothetical protein